MICENAVCGVVWRNRNITEPETEKISVDLAIGQWSLFYFILPFFYSPVQIQLTFADGVVASVMAWHWLWNIYEINVIVIDTLKCSVQGILRPSYIHSSSNRSNAMGMSWLIHIEYMYVNCIATYRWRLDPRLSRSTNLILSGWRTYQALRYVCRYVACSSNITLDSMKIKKTHWNVNILIKK